MKNLFKALSLAAVLAFGFGAISTASASPSWGYSGYYGHNYGSHSVHRGWGRHHHRGHHGRSHIRLGHIGYGHNSHRRHWY